MDANNRRMEIILSARDPGFILANYQSEDVAMLQAEGLPISIEDGVYVLDISIDVTKEDEPQLVYSRADPMIANIEKLMFEANMSAAHIASGEFWSQLKAEMKTENEKGLKTIQEKLGNNITVEMDADGDIVLDYDPTDAAFFAGTATVPATKNTAFSVEDALEIGNRMIEEREIKAHTFSETDPMLAYDIISKGTLNRLSSVLATSEPYTVGGVTVGNAPRVFAFDKDGIGLHAKDLRTNKIREVVVAETYRHLEILTSFYARFGILIIENDELGGVNVGYWHEDAFKEDNSHWRARNTYCRSYVEAGLIAAKIRKEQGNPKRAPEAPSHYSGYPIPSAVLAERAEALRQ